MSDKFYGIFQAEDATYSNYNGVLHQQQQQLNQSFPPSGLNQRCAELSNYYGTSSGNTNGIVTDTALAASSTLDVANAHTRLLGPSLHYFGGCNSQSQLHTQQHQHLFYNNNPLAQSNAPLSENCAYSIPTTTLELNGGLVGGGAAGSMSYSYSRNRYMPYNRTTTNTTAAAQYQPNCSLGMPSGMPRALNTLPLTNAMSASAQQMYATYQQFSNIYQNYPNYLGGPPLASSTVTAAAMAGKAPSECGSEKSTNAALECSRRAAVTLGNCGTAVQTMRRSLATTAVGGMTDTNSVMVTDINGNVELTKSCGSCNATASQSITLQITNLDYTMEESSLRNFLMGQLKPITPVLSLVFEGNSYAKVTVPDMFFAKQVVSNLHRKKIGHKRMLVSYTRDSSLTEINTLRCQVAGLLKDVPYYTLPMYKFRELFQARFKTSISVLDLYKMPDICTISVDNSEEKFISLQTGVINSLENSPLMEGLQHSVPYCTVHFKREQHKGWAEQDIEPLPNVWMTISEIQKIIYPLLKNHSGDIPVASLVHCINGQMNTEIIPNENGVNLEHLVCCVQGIQIQVNNFGIKILGWLEAEKDNYANYAAPLNASIGATSATSSSSLERGLYSKSACGASDPLYQISREVIELVKMSPKSTMKFNRFIPAYHNHFGKQCRVADYGYTKLIELFEALCTVVQIIGDGENRQITLTHRTQLRRFTSDLLRILRAHGNKSVLLSQLPTIFAQTQNRTFDVTDYGVCDIRDILDGLANSNVVVMSRVSNSDDMLISMPKRKQTNVELEKTILFAGEMVELFRNAPQYTILFQKFVRSYHYHFAYQCRLSDYGFLKLADLMEAIQGVVEMEQTNDEDKKIYLTPKVARRVFAEQCEELVSNVTGTAQTCTKLDEMLQLHKKKYGYQILPQTLGVSSIAEGVAMMPYIELLEKEDNVLWIICHREDTLFRNQSYRACRLILAQEGSLQSSFNESAASDTKENHCKNLTLAALIEEFNKKYEEKISESTVKAMKHLIEIFTEEEVAYVRSTSFLKFLLNIIRVVEKRTTVMLTELKNALHCNITTTFEFGYPNLFSVVSAFTDIFLIHTGLTQERSEISLQPNCELPMNASTSRSGSFSGVKNTNSKQKPSRPLRLPLSENNNSRSYSLQGPPAKTRALSTAIDINNNYQVTSNNYKAKTTCSIAAYQPPLKIQRSAATKPKPPPLQLLPQQQSNQQQNVQQHQQQSFTALASHSSYNGNASIYSVASNNSSLNMSASSSAHMTDQSLNSSFGGAFNTSLNSTNLSLSDLNMSRTQLKQTEFSQATTDTSAMCATTTTMAGTQLGGTAKFWDRRHAAAIAAATAASLAFQQQQQQSHMMSEKMSVLPSLIMSTSEGAAMDAHGQHQLHTQQQQLQQQQQQYQSAIAQGKIKQEPSAYVDQPMVNMHMYPMYEPPKPDTPPSNNMPFWIDPIWSHSTADSEAGQNALLNIKLPELKSFNVLPMVLSPYTISKAENMKQKVFNFENHDRKIA